MIQLASVGYPRESCCLSSPHRILERAAGIAFNFSAVVSDSLYSLLDPALPADTLSSPAIP